MREAVAEDAARLVLGRGPAAQAAAAHEIAADVLRLLRHEAQSGGGFAPAELELAFGFADDERRRRSCWATARCACAA